MKIGMIGLSLALLFGLTVSPFAQSLQEVTRHLQGDWQDTSTGFVLSITDNDYMLLDAADTVIDAGKFALSGDAVTVFSYSDGSQTRMRYGFQNGFLLIQDASGVSSYRKVAGPKKFKSCPPGKNFLLC